LKDKVVIIHGDDSLDDGNTFNKKVAKRVKAEQVQGWRIHSASTSVGVGSINVWCTTIVFKKK
jgi:hypothetical protein